MEKERCKCYICPFEALSQGEFGHHLKYKHKIIWKKAVSTTTEATTTTEAMAPTIATTTDVKTTIAIPPTTDITTTIATPPTTDATITATTIAIHEEDIKMTDISESISLHLPTTLQQQQVPCPDIDRLDHSGSPLQQQQHQVKDEDDAKGFFIKEESYDFVLSDDEDFASDQHLHGNDDFADDDKPDNDDLGDNEEVDDNPALLEHLHEQALLNFAFVKIDGFCCKVCSTFKTTDIQQLKTHQLSSSCQEGWSFIPYTLNQFSIFYNLIND